MLDSGSETECLDQQLLGRSELVGLEDDCVPGDALNVHFSPFGRASKSAFECGPGAAVRLFGLIDATITVRIGVADQVSTHKWQYASIRWIHGRCFYSDINSKY